MIHQNFGLKMWIGLEDRKQKHENFKPNILVLFFEK